MSTDPQDQNPTIPADPEPTEHNIAANQEADPTLPDDTHDYTSAAYNFRATLDGTAYKTSRFYNAKIGSPPGSIWNLEPYSFLVPPEPGNTAPPTVNPYLWRQAKLNMYNGLFMVTSRDYIYNGQPVTRGIYQVRAFDLSNMTIVETNNGIIVIDPLVSTETAQAALNLYNTWKNSPTPAVVKAVIYTHSHIDHYGGVLGVVTQAQVTSGQVPVYAPDGFLDHAISENAFAGNAMGRRAFYMYGTFIDKDVRGQVDCGLGKGLSKGTTSLIAPTIPITENLSSTNVDGVDITFMLAQDTEAPAEMLFYFPQFRALCAAEDMTHNLHNLYSIRGSQVRNAMAWWKVINDTIKLFSAGTDVLFAQHHWPMWTTHGTDIVGYLKSQRDLYKYILDQSLRLLNHGRTMLELSELLVLPASLSDKWFNRGFYGTVNHDSKAVYQRYLGWYDANPANLHGLPPVQVSRKYVEYMGGPQAVIDKARDDYVRGQYRWVAEAVNHVIFAAADSNSPNPGVTTRDAKELQAKALEQMGFAAESGPWRNAYLMGAAELRRGVIGPTKSPLNSSVLNAMTLEQYFDYMGLRFNAPNAETALATSPVKSWTIKWLVSNSTSSSGGNCLMEFMDYALPYTIYNQGEVLPAATVTITISRDDLNSLANSETPVIDFDLKVASGAITVSPPGNKDKVSFILGKLDFFPANFNIVTPRPDAT